MNNRAFVRSRWRIALAIPALMAAVGVVADGPCFETRHWVTEMPMTVQTEGTTYGEYLARQVDLQSRLNGAVPASAMHQPVRIELTRDEIDGIERGARVSGTPQRIGLVKVVSPRLDVDGL